MSEKIDCTEAMERNFLDQFSPPHPQAVPLTGMFVLITSYQRGLEQSTTLRRKTEVSNSVVPNTRETSFRDFIIRIDSPFSQIGLSPAACCSVMPSNIEIGNLAS